MASLTVKAAAQRLGLSPSLVYSLCAFGVIRHTRHGRPGKRGTIRISEEAIAEYQASCRTEQRAVPSAIPHFKHLNLPSPF
jgi:excisionase family DNA binding protein